MISFDIKSLFTNIPLEKTIAVILGKVYEQTKIITKFPKKTIRYLLLLCAKHIHFGFNGKMCIQLEKGCCGSPCGSILANIFMKTLEKHLIPTLGDCRTHWERYVDDTHF